MEMSAWTRIFQNEASDLLNGDTWDLEFDADIVPEHPEFGWQQYIRNTSGRFQCSNCVRSWPSNRVMVVFHMRLMDKRGTVKVRWMRQNCKDCIDPPMVSPSITPENITTLMRNLVKKIRIKCYHENLDQGYYDYERLDVRSAHEPAHCEGCMKGICCRE